MLGEAVGLLYCYCSIVQASDSHGEQRESEGFDLFVEGPAVFCSGPLSHGAMLSPKGLKTFVLPPKDSFPHAST